MPQFETHIAVSSVGSAFLVAYGSARLGWDAYTPWVAFIAGVGGGMVPDLDSDTSKPLRLAGLVTALAAACGAFIFVTSNGDFLNRPWPWEMAAIFTVFCFVIFNLVIVTAFKRLTRHRGLFHSLAVPFLYGGLLACLVMPHSPHMALAVWLLGMFGVFSHLILDSLKSLSFNPLKLATSDLKTSTRLWLLTTFVTLMAFTRMTDI
ncbi:MAG: metal-dependent hydrolase [Candidatus Adiutrix sp.]